MRGSTRAGRWAPRLAPDGGARGARFGPCLLAALALLVVPAGALAQQLGPQACGQDAAHADYGPIRPGTIVVPQRHRFVTGDPNWDARMGRFLGRPARVVRLSGVDGRGCPGVRLDVDDGRFFWRVRDLTIGAERPTRVVAIAREDRIPEACGLSDESARYGPVRVGTVVVLGRHRAVGGDDNWTPSMGAYVGRVARVTQLAGTDERGCPGVFVDIDGGDWFWRVRDLRLGEGEEHVAYARGVAGDHGRAPTGAAGGTGAAGDVPQECGMTDETARFGPIAVGTEVVLGRHRPVRGDANWTPEMDAYVGHRARVTQLVGVDEQGCPLVRVDVDRGEWYWRVRDVRLP